MHQKWILAASSGLMLTGIIAGALTNVRGQAATHQAPATSPAIKPAEEAFKNIQVLKGIPSDQVFPSMQFIAASLGVDCEFCHVKDAFEKDDKPNKATARKMIAMQMAINKDNFKSRPQVTCYSCHRGSNDPVAIPIISDELPKPAEAPAAAEAAAPPKIVPDQVLEKYTQAVGGAAALQKFSSRVEKGTIAFGGHQFPVEIVAKAPDKRMAIVQAPNGENITAFNGSSGWLAGGGNPAHPMTPSEFEI